MKAVSLICPKCGGNLEDVQIVDGKNDIYCPFCGNHIFLENENHHVIERIDRTKIAETETLLKLKELEFAEKKHNDKMALLWTAVSIVLVLLVYLFMPF